jgi:hypothetical protein
MKTSPLVIGSEVAQTSNELLDFMGAIFYLQANSRVDERFFDSEVHVGRETRQN